MTTAQHTPSKGLYYRVTGRRGNAKAAFGTEGRCIYVAENHDHYGHFTGFRVGIKPITGEPVWVAATQVTEIAPPAAFAESEIARTAERTARQVVAEQFPAFVGTVGRRAATEAIVITGKDAGKRGSVFWRGEDKKNPGTFRLGLKTENGITVWCGEREALAAPDGYPMPSTETERVTLYKQAEAAMLALDGLGFAIEAARWSNRALALSAAFSTSTTSITGSL